MDDLEKALVAYQENDFDTSLNLLTPLAESGDPKAQYSLGVMYSDGNGVLLDYKEAMKWWRLSAEQGNTDAQRSLGSNYEYGRGVPQDYVLAHMWYNLSASKGNHIASVFKDRIVKIMTSAQIEKAQDLARACVAKDYKGC